MLISKNLIYCSCVIDDIDVQKDKMSRKYFLFILILAILVMTFYLPYFNNVFPVDSNVRDKDIAKSPPFSNQEIVDPYLDWIDLSSKNYTKNGDRSTDVVSADYYSDGKTLNALLWTYWPFQPNQSAAYKMINYGMYIDADFDDRTGYGGIDYKYELSWNNVSKEWTAVLEKWSHHGEKLVLDNETVSYTNFSKKDAHYVKLSLNLDAILSPERYKAVFYAEVRKDGKFITDFTRMVAIPPLEIEVIPSSNSIELRKGEEKTIEIQVHTTQGYEPTVNIHAKSQSKQLILDFTQNDGDHDNSEYVPRIPSYGVATIPLKVTSTENATIGPHTLFIFVNSSFPAEHLIRPKSVQGLSTTFLPTSVTSENTFTQSSLLVTIQEPLTLIDPIHDFWDKLGAVVSFLTGILTGQVGPWLYNRIKEQLKNNKKE